MNVWRLIPWLEVSGQLQMAIDQWLLKQHQAGKQPSTLRFYTWASPTISLGYHQLRWPASWQHLTWQEEPLQLVRRPTGGRAVLHQGDLTYMVVTSQIRGKRQDVYQKICQFLIEAWRSLGMDLHYGLARRGYIDNPNCFATATAADLVSADGCKIIGSAQLRRGQAILQHGSMFLEPDVELFTQVFGQGLPLPNLPIALQGENLINTLIDALIQAAADCFDICLLEQPLAKEEWQEILAQPSLEIGSPVNLARSETGVLDV